jgi:hypothetical protein
MSIVQISKIKHRSGNIEDLPQLDQAEFGFASDVNRLFIGKTEGNIQNIEVLTAYSNLAFDELTANTWIVGNISTGGNSIVGNITGNWQLTPGSVIESSGADLAEYYSADKKYEPGTVLEFGGDNEVTIAGIESNKIAGVVTTEPSYVMNSNIQAQHSVALALTGRVPCKVTGKVHKGDMMISAGNGYAKAAVMEPKMGTVIGKSLSNFEGEDGLIEVVVGKL